MRMRKLIMGMQSLLLVCLLFISASAATAANAAPVVEYRNTFTESNKPAYLYKYGNGKGQLFNLPSIPKNTTRKEKDYEIADYYGFQDYSIVDVNNGYIIMNMRYHDYGLRKFDVPYALDINAGYIRYSKALNEMDTLVKFGQLPNGNYATEDPAGIFKVYTPDGSKEVKLTYIYGEKLELPKFKFKFLADDTLDFYTYVGKAITYNPYSEQYIMIYCLSELYGTDGSKSNGKLSKMRVAVFNKTGELVKRFIVKDQFIDGSSLGSFSEFVEDPNWYSPTGDIYGVYNDYYRATLYPLKNEPNKVLLTNVSDRPAVTITIDIEKEESVEASKKDESNAVKSVPASVRLLPYRVEYRTDGTYILSRETGNVLQFLKGDYELVSPYFSPDGISYAVFAAGQEYSEHPYGK